MRTPSVQALFGEKVQRKEHLHSKFTLVLQRKKLYLFSADGVPTYHTMRHLLASVLTALNHISSLVSFDVGAQQR